MNRKLVVFVPPASLEVVRSAPFAAGAGEIGAYERCSWYTEGTGTFFGGEGTDPAIGQPGVEEREAEIVAALREAHPYEEPAFDLYRLA